MKISKLIVGAMGTNCYLLIGDNKKECAVVDPGADGDKIISAIEKRGLVCTHILLTHAHFDHIMALEEVRAATGARVYIHGADAEFLTDNELNCMSRFTSDEVRCGPAEETISDGDEIMVAGESVKVKHTPGHTPGSVCYEIGDTIISGDTLFRDNIGRYDLPGGDFMTLLHSLSLLAELPGDRKVCPGHGASTTLERERESNLYLH